MSKQIVWGTEYGEGTVECCCDQCGEEIDFEFEDCKSDFGVIQQQLFECGWTAFRYHGKWHDFCCEKCRDQFIKTH